MEALIILFVAAAAVGIYWAYRESKSKKNGKKPTHGPVKQGDEGKNIKVRPAGENINVPPDPAPQPVPVEPVPKPKVSATRSRIYIVADRPVNSPGNVEAVAGEYGFKTGESMTIVVEAMDDQGNPQPGVPVRGIIDLFSGSQLPTVPKHGVTRPDGTFQARFTMREEDQLPDGSKLITAALVVGDSTVTLKPFVLNDALTA